MKSAVCQEKLQNLQCDLHNASTMTIAVRTLLGSFSVACALTYDLVDTLA